MCDNTLKIRINSLVIFLPVFELRLKLTDVTTTWFSISGGQGCPNFSRRSGTGDNRLERSGNGTNERTIDKSILAFSDRVRWVHREIITGGEHDRRSNDGAIKITGQVIAIKQGVDLKTPHEVVDGGEFGDAGHVDGDESLVVGDIDGFSNRRRRGVVRGRHGGIAASAAVFTLQNNCPYTVWPGTLASKGITLGDGGFELTQGASKQLTAPDGWSGRFWARTGCNFDGSGNGKCDTGDCTGGLKCTGTGFPPVTLAEFTLVGDAGQDFYDVSLVDGYNVKLGIKPSTDCKYAACASDLNADCPDELKVTGQQNNVVACKSACTAFTKEEYCCTGAHDKAETCPPTNYSMIFKKACPDAYSYAYDDVTSLFTCTGADYTITFCP
ncbi:PREDICTED: pathogenesis-related protein 5-like [Camelina sativa]|uniref:Pathogenesis-related protein 5-like n=1 Tax=Camelina sativa TaxID=90675 RepID=A0ABM1Q7D9_CAMSA|nr:PREDICTED: pathogenesis-related protein 5-like [Camelina sativa]